MKNKPELKNQTNKTGKTDTFSLIASLRRYRSTQKYTARPREHSLHAGFLGGLADTFLFVGCKILKPLIPILLLFISASCSTTTDKTLADKNKFDTLPLPLDSSAFYFKTKPSWQDTTQNALDTFVNKWYSKMFFGLREPVLSSYEGEKEIYRFTWLRTFNHPVSIRVEKQGDVIKLFSKVTNGAGGYEPGQLIVDTIFDITDIQYKTLLTKLEQATFWTMRTEDSEEDGKDGSEWIIEAVKDNKYHMTTRWTPQKGTEYRKVGEYLFSISGIENEMTGRAQGNY